MRVVDDHCVRSVLASLLSSREPVAHRHRARRAYRHFGAQRVAARLVAVLAAALAILRVERVELGRAKSQEPAMPLVGLAAGGVGVITLVVSARPIGPLLYMPVRCSRGPPGHVARATVFGAGPVTRFGRRSR